jgi:hypothetical protein
MTHSLNIKDEIQEDFDPFWEEIYPTACELREQERACHAPYYPTEEEIERMEKCLEEDTEDGTVLFE